MLNVVIEIISLPHKLTFKGGVINEDLKQMRPSKQGLKDDVTFNTRIANLPQSASRCFIYCARRPTQMVMD